MEPPGLDGRSSPGRFRSLPRSCFHGDKGRKSFFPDQIAYPRTRSAMISLASDPAKVNHISYLQNTGPRPLTLAKWDVRQVPIRSAGNVSLFLRSRKRRNGDRPIPSELLAWGGKLVGCPRVSEFLYQLSWEGSPGRWLPCPGAPWPRRPSWPFGERRITSGGGRTMFPAWSLATRRPRSSLTVV